MRRAEIITAFILGILSIYLMWKSGEAPDWNPDIARFDNIGLIDGEGPGSGFWPFWLSAVMLICSIWIGVNWYRRTSPPSQSEEEFLDGYGRRMLFVVGGGLFGFLILIEVVRLLCCDLGVHDLLRPLFGTSQLVGDIVYFGWFGRCQLFLF